MENRKLGIRQEEQIRPAIEDARKKLDDGRISRREFLRFAGILSASAATASLVAACGGLVTDVTTPTPGTPVMATEDVQVTIPSNGAENPFPEPACVRGHETCIRSEGDETPPVTLTGDQVFAPNQFILTGLPQDISSLLDQIRANLDLADEQILQLAAVNLEGVLGAQDFDTGGFGSIFTFDEWPALAVELYEVTEDVALEDMFGQMAAIIVEFGGELRVLADLNYVTGFPIDGAPWPVEGAPWPVEGAPWPVEGATIGDPGAATGNQLFWSQWAFGQTAGGIEHVETVDDTTFEPLSELTGAGVRIGVFDASPFEMEQCCYDFDRWVSYPPQGGSEARSPCIHSWFPVNVPVADPPDMDASDHGLFVAGLCFGAAPDSEIHLIRVLNERAQGDLHGLIRAMAWFTGEVLFGECGEGSLENTIYNLSLVARSEDGDYPQDIKDSIVGIAETLGYTFDILPSGLPLPCLELICRTITAGGGTIVAAAGNDSADDPLNPRGAAYPAAFDNVIGVAASNQEGARSCYSNEGDVYAPGGDGGDDGTDACAPLVSACGSDFANCEYGVISLTLRNPGMGFGLWVGSSFATPIASGLAAQLRQNNTTPSPAQLSRGTSSGLGGDPKLVVVK